MKLNIKYSVLQTLIETIIKDNPEVFSGNEFLVERFVKLAKANMTNSVTESLGETLQVLKDKYNVMTDTTDGKVLVVTEFKDSATCDWYIASDLNDAAQRIEDNFYNRFKGQMPLFSVWKDRKLIFNNNEIRRWGCLHVTFKRGNDEKGYTTIVETEHDEYCDAFKEYKEHVEHVEGGEYGSVRRVLDVRPQGNTLASTIIQMKDSDSEYLVNVTGHFKCPPLEKMTISTTL